MAAALHHLRSAPEVPAAVLLLVGGLQLAVGVRVLVRFPYQRPTPVPLTPGRARSVLHAQPDEVRE